MDITPLVPAGRQIIQSYSPGAFSISGRRYTTPLVVFPDGTEVWPVAKPLADMTAPASWMSFYWVAETAWNSYHCH